MDGNSAPPRLVSGPPSPCIGVCRLDARGFCEGCLRTGEEIGAWLRMGATERWALLSVLAARRAKQEVC